MPKRCRSTGGRKSTSSGSEGFGCGRDVVGVGEMGFWFGGF